MTLYLIGNGFDRYHGLPTLYKDYGSFLCGDDHDRFNCYSFVRDDEKVCSRDQFMNFKSDTWERLEDALNIDIKELMIQTLDGRNGLACDDISLYLDFTGKHLRDWINSISVSDVKKQLDFLPNSLFITFNYTLVLEEVYKIADERILHVHGKKGDKILQFGNMEFMAYGNDKAEQIIFEYMRANPSIECSVKEAHEYLYYVKEAFGKDPKSNYSAINRFLSNKQIDSIIVLGLSLSKQDQPYFTDIFIPKFGNKKWVVSYYGSDDLKKKKSFCKGTGLKCSFKTLEEATQCPGTGCLE